MEAGSVHRNLIEESLDVCDRHEAVVEVLVRDQEGSEDGRCERARVLGLRKAIPIEAEIRQERGLQSQSSHQGRHLAVPVEPPVGAVGRGEEPVVQGAGLDLSRRVVGQSGVEALVPWAPEVHVRERGERVGLMPSR